MLNKQQQQFVDSNSDYILLLAPAGSGKSKSITYKIAKFAEERVHPRNILCVTFTRAAGINLKDRCVSMIGESANEMFCNTFHSFCIDVIRKNAKYVSSAWEDDEILNGKIDFTIYDQVDRNDILKKIIKKLNLKCTVSNVESFMNSDIIKLDKCFKDPKLVANEYNLFCEENFSIDLDFIISKATELLKIEAVKANYDYECVIVDEWQDSTIQMLELLKVLKPKKLYVVGDIRQAIYGWNGSEIKNIINFSNEWKDVEVIKLQNNYRNTREIVKAGEIIIANVVGMPEMNVIAHKSGEPINFYTGASVDEEFEYVRQQIEKRGGPLSEHTILCRTNALAVNAADYLKMKDVPVNLVSNANDPFKKDHVKRVMKFIQFALNPMDSFSYEQSINFPIRRVSEYQVHQAINDAFLNEKPITDYSDKHFAIMCKQLAKSFDKDANETFIQALNLLEIVQEYVMKGLTNRIKDFDDVDKEITRWKKKSRDKSIKSFMRWLCIKDIQEKTIEKVEAVNIMTCHASKGLEWDHVYICGVTSGIFPSEKASQDIEEERRLMHVAITRAKETVDITSAEYYRTPYGQIFTAGPSEFYKMLEG